MRKKQAAVEYLNAFTSDIIDTGVCPSFLSEIYFVSPIGRENCKGSLWLLQKWNIYFFKWKTRW